jgi:hypothetical protein
MDTEEREKCKQYKTASYIMGGLIVAGVAYTVWDQYGERIKNWFSSSSTSSSTSSSSSSSTTSTTRSLRAGSMYTGAGTPILEFVRGLESSKATGVSFPIVLEAGGILTPSTYLQSANGHFLAQQHASGALQVLCASAPNDPNAKVFFTTGSREGSIKTDSFHTAVRSDDVDHVLCTYSGKDQSANGPPIWCAPLREEFSLERHGKPLLFLSNTGQLVLYGDKMTTKQAPLWLSPSASNCLGAGIPWRESQFLQSKNKEFYAIQERDGPLSIFRANNPLVEKNLASQLVWTSATPDFPRTSGATYTTMLNPDNGRLTTVRRTSGAAGDVADVWHSDPVIDMKSNRGRQLLVFLTDTGCLQIAFYDDPSNPIWTTPIMGTRSAGSRGGPAAPLPAHGRVGLSVPVSAPVAVSAPGAVPVPAAHGPPGFRGPLPPVHRPAAPPGAPATVPVAGAPPTGAGGVAWRGAPRSAAPSPVPAQAPSRAPTHAGPMMTRFPTVRGGGGPRFAA